LGPSGYCRHVSAYATQAEPTGLFASLKRFARRLRDRLVAGARWLRERAAALLRKLRSPFAALLGAAAGDGEPSFGARWLMVTLVVALALGLVVAALLSPVVGLLAFIGVGIWALVRRTSGRRRNRRAAES
jgi:Flp pilus assembly protein TadB